MSGNLLRRVPCQLEALLQGTCVWTLIKAFDLLLPYLAINYYFDNNDDE